MRLIERVLGARGDSGMAEALHRLEHQAAIDFLYIDDADIERRRFKATTERGEELAVALPREERLFDGAVLALDTQGAIVVRVAAPAYLRVTPRDASAALELGYNAGNLHWRVAFEGATLRVALDGPANTYTSRLARMIDTGRVVIEEDC